MCRRDAEALNDLAFIPPRSTAPVVASSHDPKADRTFVGAMNGYDLDDDNIDLMYVRIDEQVAYSFTKSIWACKL